ncbi:MAG: 2-C-methyl-D-erythritol 4-phosphate cytidylyltransferase [Atribacterota bacterium]|nr:2-C-methyl-D-erythritol 4-phosphate cytidylyltransferase [Atribacterota bacterium]
MSNIAIIAAAGNGERLDSCDSKMLVNIAGKPLLVHTLNVFEKSEKIDEIVLVVHKKDLKKIEKEVIEKNKYQKLSKIVLGGFTRQESVFKGLQAIKENNGRVCIHDGARPLIEEWMIERTIEEVDTHEGAIMAVPVIETIKKVIIGEMLVKETVNREEYWIVQTPQAFNIKYAKNIYKRAIEEELSVTDDASIAEHYDGKVKIIPGSRENIKITTSIDILLAEILIKKRLNNI